MIKAPLSLEHQDIIGKKLDAIGMHLSEFSFPNLYLFRQTHQYETVTTPHGFFISGVTYDNKKYLMPMTSPEKTGNECFSEMKELLKSGEWDFVFPVPREWLKCFDEKDFEVTFSPNDSDYLFYTEKFKLTPANQCTRRRTF